MLRLVRWSQEADWDGKQAALLLHRFKDAHGDELHRLLKEVRECMHKIK